LKSEDEGWPDVDDLRPEVEPLISLIDAYSLENNIDASKFDVLGFSQGGAMVNVMALTHPERINRAGILASFVPANSESLIHSRPLNGIKFFVTHGRLDETVKIKHARESVKMLEMAGADVTFCEDDVGHKVSARCMRALEEFFT
jgi:phospholipase/carboxylesterase